MKRPDRLTCEETFRRLDDFVDRELSAADQRLVEEHLRECAVCASEFRFEADVIAELRAKLQRIQLPTQLRANIASRLRREAPDAEGT